MRNFILGFMAGILVALLCMIGELIEVRKVKLEDVAVYFPELARFVYKRKENSD